MNPIAEEIKSYFGSAKMSEEEFIAHYGVGHLQGGHSGRFPWGSGKDPYQGYPIDFLTKVENLKKKGWKETGDNIQKEFGLTSTEYRIIKSIATDAIRMSQIERAQALNDQKKGKQGPSAIAKRMGVNESTVRGWLNTTPNDKVYLATKVADFLQKEVDKKKMLDVGTDSERDVLDTGVSREKMNVALYILQQKGYNVYLPNMPQPTNPTQMTRQKILTVPEIKGRDGKYPKEIYDYDKIGTIKDYISKDGGMTFEKKFTYPESLNSKRLMIRYADDVGKDGIKGIDKDGLIELRRGVQDLSLGSDHYSQVRILVDKTHYIKGMAVYSDNMPDGIDVIFNTNKNKDVPVFGTKDRSVLKPIKSDPDNPFGSAIKDADQGGQYWYVDSKTGKKKLGLINKRAAAGDWEDWDNALPSQFLSKQSKSMAKKQLNLDKALKEAEYADIMELNNPTVKKHFLNEFASKCDGAAADLKAAALPNQHYHVIIPINAMGDEKIYAPRYKDGTKLALIRYPHGGIFEIPVLTVDNKNAKARKIIPPDSIDAVGISKKVAERLSGADFDGDTVMCIPTDDRYGRVHILRKDNLPGLKGFNPDKYQYEYAEKDKHGNTVYYRNGKKMNVMKNTDMEMGKISNLITDMTLSGGATDDELARAVRHSMVVIDAEKHKLDYQASYKENNIKELKHKYQRKETEDGVKYGGASTIISRSSGPIDVPKRRGDARVNLKDKYYYDSSKPEGSLIHLLADSMFNKKGTKYYDSSKPEGAIIPVKSEASKLYYAVSKYDKKTGIRTIRTSDGKEIQYNLNDKKAREKYDPILNFDKDGNVIFTNKKGDIKYEKGTRTTKIKGMDSVDNAYDLVSADRHPMEIIYADYANSMKAMANRARIEIANTPNLQYNSKAAKVYAKEVSSLNAKLNEAKKNRPKERQATRLANAEINKKKETNPDLQGEDLRKVSQQALTKYRQEVGSVSRSKRSIKIEPKEWQAIQSGAISNNKLKEILDNSDPKILRELSMPKTGRKVTTAQIMTMKALRNSNFTLQQIADKMNLDASTVSKYLKGGN